MNFHIICFISSCGSFMKLECISINFIILYMDYEVVGLRPRGRPERTWREVVDKDCRGCCGS